VNHSIVVVFLFCFVFFFNFNECELLEWVCKMVWIDSYWFGPPSHWIIRSGISVSQTDSTVYWHYTLKQREQTLLDEVDIHLQTTETKGYTCDNSAAVPWISSCSHCALYFILQSKKCWIVLTQFWVKYGQTQTLG